MLRTPFPDHIYWALPKARVKVVEEGAFVGNTGLVYREPVSLKDATVFLLPSWHPPGAWQILQQVLAFGNEK